MPKKLNLLKLATRFLKEHPGIDHCDLAWVFDIAERTRFEELPADRQPTDGPEKKQYQEHAAAYQELSDAMLETPQLAYRTFNRCADRFNDHAELARVAKAVLLIGKRTSRSTSRLNTESQFTTAPPELVVARQAFNEKRPR